jgi:hypothetical protein
VYLFDSSRSASKYQAIILNSGNYIELENFIYGFEVVSKKVRETKIKKDKRPL